MQQKKVFKEMSKIEETFALVPFAFFPEKAISRKHKKEPLQKSPLDRPKDKLAIVAPKGLMYFSQE